MSDLKTLQFSSEIHATPAVVWQHITTPESYQHWTAAFAEGSHFKGSWETGDRILFLAPGGDGMVAEIAESRRHTFIAIRHLGVLTNGVEDTTSPAVRAWAPAYENYTLQATPAGTRLVVDQQVPEAWAEYLAGVWPKALQRLKGLCEAA